MLKVKAPRKISFKSPGQSFAATKAKQNCTGAKLCSAKLQATGTKNEHLPWYIQIIQSFAPMCMVEQSFALVHIRHATVLLQNFVPVACNFVLHLWLAPLCCKALPLYSSALQLVLRRAFYLQHWQLIEMNWLTASYHEILPLIHPSTFLSASLLIWLSLCIVFCHRTVLK